MKTRCLLALLLSAVLAGCAAPGTANTKKNRDDIALLAEHAKSHEKSNGNLDGDYVVDLLLDGKRDKNKPVFDQPRGN